MKKIVFFLLITINLFSNPLGQKNNFDRVINMQSTVAEIFYSRLEVSTRLPYFANKFIDHKAVKRPEVPANIWQTIKNSIDYTHFKNLAIQVLNNNFTTSEMQQIITKYEGTSYIPITHLKLRKELLFASQESNIVMLNQINSILIANGYQPL